MRLFLFFMISCLVYQSCNTSRNCSSSFYSLIKDKIELNTYFDNEFKKIEKKRKKQLMDCFCNELNGITRVLFIETYSDKVYGLLHIYGKEKNYTYEQDLEKIKISNSFKYDKYGNLRTLFHSLDSNVVEQLEQKKYMNKLRQRPDDAPIVRIYYIDLLKNHIQYFYF